MQELAWQLGLYRSLVKVTAPGALGMSNLGLCCAAWWCCTACPFPASLFLYQAPSAALPPSGCPDVQDWTN